MTKVSLEAIKLVCTERASLISAQRVWERQAVAVEPVYRSTLDHARLIETYEPERLIDPDLLEARRIVADHVTVSNVNVRTLAGEKDDTPIVRAVLAALKSRPKP